MMFTWGMHEGQGAGARCLLYSELRAHYSAVCNEIKLQLFDFKLEPERMIFFNR